MKELYACHVKLFVVALALLISCKSDLGKENNQDSNGDNVKPADFALAQLESSPRHHEWIVIQNGDQVIHAFVAYPETKGDTKAIMVIHENRGLNNWARSLADQLAEAGYLAIAPDLLSNFDETHEKTTDFATSDDAKNALYQLDMNQVLSNLDATFDYIKNAKSSTGEVSAIGFCWGGSRCFSYATHNPDLKNALVFYGTAPKEGEGFQNINTPVYGFYGGKDNRVNSTIDETARNMKANDKLYEYVIYEGAGHAFMRRGDDPDGGEANIKARDQAWHRIKEILEAS